jgi:hypothetical protein
MVVVINELAYTIVGAPTARESDPSLILVFVFFRIYLALLHCPHETLQNGQVFWYLGTREIL